MFDRDRRGWDPNDLLVVVVPGRPDTRAGATYWRTERLVVPPSAQVLDALAVAGASVIEFRRPNPQAAIRRRMHTEYHRRQLARRRRKRT